MVKPGLSKGWAVCRSTVAPSEPSSTSAEAILWTVSWLNSSEAYTLKSKERPRLAPPEMSSEPVVARASMPLMRTRVKVEFRPRTEICRPSPWSRARVIPGMRCSASDTLRSGNLAMSSARMLSEESTAWRFMSSACSRLERKPLTTTVSTGAGAPPAVCGACSTARRMKGRRTISPSEPSDTTSRSVPRVSIETA